MTDRLVVEAKPFSKNFDKQVDVCRELYGSQLTISNTYEISETVKENICKMYGEKVFNRMEYIFNHQKYLYPEQFSSCQNEKIDRSNYLRKGR